MASCFNAVGLDGRIYVLPVKISLQQMVVIFVCGSCVLVVSLPKFTDIVLRLILRSVKTKVMMS